MAIRQCVCYPILGPAGRPLERLFKAAAEIGFQGVELWQRDETLDDVARLARDNGLALVSMCGHGSAMAGLNDATQHDRIVDELRQSLEIAARLGMTGLICFGGKRNPDRPLEDEIETAAACLRRVAAHAERQGINLNIELLNTRVDHPGYMCDRTFIGAAICRAVASPRVKLLYDIYHMQIMEGDIIRTIREHLNLIGHIHTAGNPGRGDLNDQQELNYTGICRALAAGGYGGYVGHEFRPAGDVVEALRAAYAVCNVQGGS